jgi:ribosome-binding protein aMBF1 (putative translation factor)
MKLPTGRQITAARNLAGLHQRELAKLAKLHPTTINRMEMSGAESVRGQARNIERVVQSLEKRGVVITARGVELIAKKR